jgi:3-deoxy-7-phosphoheptulonate synthase
MIIVMNPKSNQTQVDDVVNILKNSGLGVHVSQGAERTIIGIIGDKSVLRDIPLELMPGVEKLVPIVESFKLAGKTFRPEPSVIDVNGVKIGGKELAIMAGPCAIESLDQILAAAHAVKKSGSIFKRWSL